MLNNIIAMKDGEIEELQELLKESDDRLEKLEDAFKRDQGIEIRNITKELICDFNESELAILKYVLEHVIGETKNIDTIKHYLKLYDKFEKLGKDLHG